jgi:hypothetical protein
LWDFWEKRPSMLCGCRCILSALETQLQLDDPDMVFDTVRFNIEGDLEMAER